ncbi:MAG: hypothetical protein B7Y02_18680, partial [Rhodobacterales bacterium 17-64-5]
LPGDVVDLTGVPALRGITQGAGLRIGACTTWAEIAEAALPPALMALQQAALQVGGRQIQNAGTIGGNICNASPAADGIPPLLVLEAELELVSLTGTRRIALEQALIGPRKLALAPGEVLVAIHIPQPMLAGASAFHKLGTRSHLVISVVMGALWLAVEGGTITRARAAIGSCAPTARRLPALEQALTGQPIAEVQIDPAMILPVLAPITDIRATAEYRAQTAVSLLRRLCERIAG